MAGIIEKKVKGSSLLEVMIAMVILMIVFGIGMMVYLNILNSTFSLQQLNYSLELRKLASIAKSQKTYFDESIEKEGIVIEKTIEKYEGSKDLLLLEFTVMNAENRQLANYKELILVKDGQ